jgi:phospholipase/carboxylesterase
MAHGTADTIIPLSQGLQSYRLLNELGYSVVWRDYPMPHAVCPAEIADIGAWIKARLLD